MGEGEEGAQTKGESLHPTGKNGEGETSVRKARRGVRLDVSLSPWAAACAANQLFTFTDREESGRAASSLRAVVHRDGLTAAAAGSQA